MQLDTVSGRVNGTGGVPLPGVTVRFEGTTVLTDGSGAFLVPSVGSLPTGSYRVAVDGSTATAMGVYPTIEVLLELVAGQTHAVLPQVVTLPDLNNPDSAIQAVTVDGTGAALDPIAVASPAGDVELAGPVGTVIAVGGAVPALAVDLNVTPVPPDEVPMPLPDGLLGSSFVTIQPGNAAFAAPGGGGLDVTLPNAGALPVGTAVDVWSFDHDDAAWVNRSEETGNQGVVVDLGGGLTAVRAIGVITEGGWHAPVIPVDPACGTTLVGRVVDALGTSLADVSVFTDLGQFATSAADGTFSLGLVPAYDLAALVAGTCVPVGVQVTAAAPPLLGSVTGSALDVLAGDLQPGGVTDVGDLVLAIPVTGCVSGIVNGTLADPEAQVALSGPTDVLLPIGPSGTFAGCGLAPGTYTASVLFAGDAQPTSVTFAVGANAVATVTLQAVVGGGTGDLTVTVVQLNLDPGGLDEPVAGAQVFLQGTDAGSAAGLVMITDANGEASFAGVDGPFQITAWAESVFAGPLFNSVARSAVSVVDLEPPGDTVTLAFDFDPTLDDGPDPDATLRGDFLGNLAGCPLEIAVSSRPNGAFFDAVDGTLDDYSFAVPSGVVLDLFVTLQCGTGTTDATSAGFVLAIPALAPGEERTVDVDVGGAGFADFDVALPVTVSNEASATSVIRSGAFQVFDPLVAGAAGFAALFTTQDAPAPSSWDLPSLDAGAFAGLEGRVSYFVTGDSALALAAQTQSFSMRLSSALPASLDVELLSLPWLDFPASPIQTDAPGALALELTAPATPAGMSGFEQVVFAGFAPAAGGGNPLDGTLVTWSIALREGSTALVLPAVAEQILEDGDYIGSLVALRFTGAPFDYDAAYAAGGFAAVLEEEPQGFVSSSNPFELQVGDAP